MAGPWCSSTHARLRRDLNAEALRVGGVADNLHIVTTLPRSLSQADTVETLKKTSSKWIKPLDPKYRQFYWQRGYGAFSGSPSQLDAALEYVENHEAHYRTCSFQEEYRDFLRNTASNSMNALSGTEVGARF